MGLPLHFVKDVVIPFTIVNIPNGNGMRAMEDYLKSRTDKENDPRITKERLKALYMLIIESVKELKLIGMVQTYVPHTDFFESVDKAQVSDSNIKQDETLTASSLSSIPHNSLKNSSCLLFERSGSIENCLPIALFWSSFNSKSARKNLLMR